MYTQCPHCETRFKITPTQAQVAGGHVRCSRCGEVFNALDHLHENPALKEAEIPDTREDPTPRERPAPPSRPAPDEPPPDLQDIFRPRPPTYLEEERSGRWAWALGSLVLLLVLVVQLTWWMRERAVHYPEGRLVLGQLCAFAGCEVPVPKEPERIHILQRDIHTDPARPGTLVVDLTVSNGAAFDQPYPRIELKLYDSRQRLVAARRFSPEEYLQRPEKEIGLMPSRLPLRVQMRLQEPKQNVTGFVFRFL